MSDNGHDPINERATRAGAGLRSMRVAPGDPQVAHRRVVRRRVAAGGTSALLAAAAVIAIVVSTRDDHIKVSTPATTTTSLAIATTTSVAPPTTTSTPTATTLVPSTTAASTIPVSTTIPANAPKVPEAIDFPPLLAANNGGMHIIPDEATMLGLPSDTRVAFRLTTCTSFAYEWGPTSQPIVGVTLGTCPVLRHIAELDGYRLDGVGVDNGHDMLLLSPAQDPGGTQPSLMFDVQAGTSRNVARGARSVAGGRLIRSLPVDNRTGLEYRTVDPNIEGTIIVAPHGDLGERSYTFPHLDPTGSRVAFIDTPDYATDNPDLVIRSLAGGPELFRLSLPWPATPTFLDFDGRWVVISRAGLPALIIDTKAATPTYYQVSNATGIVTLDR